ncbi:hypothetical protein A5N75_06705 [Prescottella equi]|nr:hypothetical protein A6F56_01590 [Prescottella equi]ORL10570.1 hypothetical protein A6I84_00765 [Prescottella equi]ORL77538.1 hypothetical protein A5N75_06705 [Prescottella equi]ORL92114.1 hypothetical protein A5N76_11710 [Prescottella equi]
MTIISSLLCWAHPRRGVDAAAGEASFVSTGSAAPIAEEIQDLMYGKLFHGFRRTYRAASPRELVRVG